MQDPVPEDGPACAAAACPTSAYISPTPEPSMAMAHHSWVLPLSCWAHPHLPQPSLVCFQGRQSLVGTTCVPCSIKRFILCHCHACPPHWPHHRVGGGSGCVYHPWLLLSLRAFLEPCSACIRHLRIACHGLSQLFHGTVSCLWPPGCEEGLRLFCRGISCSGASSCSGGLFPLTVRRAPPWSLMHGWW